MNSTNTMGSRIKEMRLKMGMTQDKLAERMSIPKSTISSYENDKVDIKGSVIMELSHHLNTTPNYILGFEVSEEQDPILDAISSIYKGIKNEKLKELLLLQIQAIGKVMG